MKTISSIEGQPSPALSYDEEHALRRFSHTPEPSDAALAPYTPPRSHPGQSYSYGDPEEYETPHARGYYEQPSYYQEAGYRTPPLPISEGGMLTRSGRAVGTPVTMASSNRSSKASPSPRAKRNKKGKEHATQFVLNQPLSIETKEYEVPVRDMMEWANRSNDERRQEVQTQHKGNIPRPLNSFMLYRQAYKERIKKWGEQGNNNQLISRVAGESWNMEPVEVKDFYARVSVVERDNHTLAFPEYKFAPNKNVRKRGRNDDDEESDAEWEGSSEYSTKRRRNRHESTPLRSRSPTPAQLVYSSPHYHPSSLQATNPHLMGPVAHYQQWGQPIQYDQYYGCAVMPYRDSVQDLHYAPTSMPVQHEHQYMHLVGMPPGSDGMVERLPPAQAQYGIDPGLSNFSPSASYSYGGYPDVDPHGEYEGEPEHISHPGMQTLAPAEPMWSPSGPAGSAFDAELTHWHGES